MSTKAKKLIKQAIKIIKEEDGASDVGCYRDVVTEVLHLANKKFRTGPYSGIGMLKHWICSMGHENFVEELEIIENGKIESILPEDLPLHFTDEFKFESSKILFAERLKKGEPNVRSRRNEVARKSKNKT